MNKRFKQYPQRIAKLLTNITNCNYQTANQKELTNLLISACVVIDWFIDNTTLNNNETNAQ